MAHGYTPGLRVTPATLLRKERRLPLPGTVHVAVGRRVAAGDLVASTHLPGNVTTANIAHDLNIQPEEVPGAMVKQEGEEVAAGEVIARTRALWGLFQSAATSPVSGTIETISGITGQVLVRGEPIPVRMEAYIAGMVVEVLQDEGVVIETTCALVQGIFGIGGETYGPLAMRASGPDDALEADMLDESCAGAIIVGGSLVTRDALERAVELGARGIIVGGVGHDDLDAFLGYPLGVAITGHEARGITLVITEGFGQISMADRAFGILAEREGMEASINGATQIRAGVIRPEVIVPYPEGQEPASVDEAGGHGLQVGSLIRLIRDPLFGLRATVVELPEQPQEIETGARVRVLVAQLEDGTRVQVPRANVELIEK